ERLERIALVRAEVRPRLGHAAPGLAGGALVVVPVLDEIGDEPLLVGGEPAVAGQPGERRDRVAVLVDELAAETGVPAGLRMPVGAEHPLRDRALRVR